MGMNLLKNRTLYERRTRGLIKRTWPLIQVSRSNSTTNGEEKKLVDIYDNLHNMFDAVLSKPEVVMLIWVEWF